MFPWQQMLLSCTVVSSSSSSHVHCYGCTSSGLSTALPTLHAAPRSLLPSRTKAQTLPVTRNLDGCENMKELHLGQPSASINGFQPCRNHSGVFASWLRENHQVSSPQEPGGSLYPPTFTLWCKQPCHVSLMCHVLFAPCLSTQLSSGLHASLEVFIVAVAMPLAGQGWSCWFSPCSLPGFRNPVFSLLLVFCPQSNAKLFWCTCQYFSSVHF